MLVGPVRVHCIGLLSCNANVLIRLNIFATLTSCGVTADLLSVCEEFVLLIRNDTGLIRNRVFLFC